MSDILTQNEADALIKMNKIAINDQAINLPDFGGRVEIPLQSQDKQEQFVLNYRRGSIDLSKLNHHFRGRKNVGLVRLDIDGKPHRNPDGIEIGPNHLHLYRQGYELKWAFEIPEDKFPNLKNSYNTLLDFLKYLYVKKIPKFNQGLFS